MNVFFTLLVLAAASAQEPLLPAFVLAGRADLLPARAEAAAGPVLLGGRKCLPLGLLEENWCKATTWGAKIGGLAPIQARRRQQQLAAIGI